MALTKYVASRVSKFEASGDYDMSGDFCNGLPRTSNWPLFFVVVVEDSYNVEVEVAQRSWRST